MRFKIGFKKTPEADPRMYALYLRPTAQVSTEVASAMASEFNVPVGERSIQARILSPPAERLAADPALLLTFATDRDRTDVQALRLSNFAPQLGQANAEFAEFHLTEDGGHSLNDSWYNLGRESLLKWLQSP